MSVHKVFLCVVLLPIAAWALLATIFIYGNIVTIGLFGWSFWTS